MCRLGEADAQTFIDVLEEVRSAFTRRHESIDRNRNQHSVGQALRIPGFSPVTNKGWLILLYKACGKHGVIPGAYKIAASYDPTENALCGGGYGDVWRGKYLGGDVAVKVLRTFSPDLLQKTVKVGL